MKSASKNELQNELVQVIVETVLAQVITKKIRGNAIEDKENNMAYGYSSKPKKPTKGKKKKTTVKRKKMY